MTDDNARGFTDEAKVGDSVRVLNKIYIRAPHGEVQIGLLSGNVVVWHKGEVTVFDGQQEGGSE